MNTLRPATDIREGPDLIELSNIDREAIEAIIMGQEAAWNRGDAEGYGEHALPDIVFTNVMGARYVGREAVVALWRGIFEGLYKGVAIHQRIENIALIHQDVALVELLNSLPADIPKLAGIFPTVNGAYLSRMQQVLVRRDDGWRVASGHNVPVLPPAASTLPKNP